MKETQTPRKDRRPKHSKSTAANSHKVAKKSLSSEFSSVSEDLSADAEVFDDSLIDESTDSVNCLFTAEEPSPPQDSTVSSKIAIIKDEQVIDSGDHGKELVTKGCVEPDVVVNLLKQARDRVSSLNDVSAESKMLLEAMLEKVVKDFDLPEEKHPVNVVSEKTRAVVFCSVVLLITMTAFVIYFCSSSRDTSSFYLPPT